MWILHCDLCGRDMTKDENKTKVEWKDNEGYESSAFFVFRQPRKFSADICDDCLKLLREKVKENT